MTAVASANQTPGSSPQPGDFRPTQASIDLAVAAAEEQRLMQADLDAHINAAARRTLVAQSAPLSPEAALRVKRLGELTNATEWMLEAARHSPTDNPAYARRQVAQAIYLNSLTPLAQQTRQDRLDLSKHPDFQPEAIDLELDWLLPQFQAWENTLGVGQRDEKEQKLAGNIRALGERLGIPISDIATSERLGSAAMGVLHGTMPVLAGTIQAYRNKAQALNNTQTLLALRFGFLERNPGA